MVVWCDGYEMWQTFWREFVCQKSNSDSIAAAYIARPGAGPILYIVRFLSARRSRLTAMLVKFEPFSRKPHLLQQRRPQLAHAEHLLRERVEHLLGDHRVRLYQLVQLAGILQDGGAQSMHHDHPSQNCFDHNRKWYRRRSLTPKTLRRRHYRAGSCVVEGLLICNLPDVYSVIFCVFVLCVCC